MCSAAARAKASPFKLPLICLAAFFLLLLPGCRGVDPVVKVALVAPFEGHDRAIGYDALYSARLAVRELNAAGGINGTRVALVALDDGGNPDYAEAAAGSLIIDPNVVAVVGHWLPQTTAAAAARYDAQEMPFLAGGQAPLQPTDPRQLPAEFLSAYSQVTPFDEIPGPYAWPAYQAYQSLWRTLQLAQEQHGQITRASVLQTINEEH